MFGCMRLGCNQRQIDTLDRRQNNLTEVPRDIDKYRALDELLLSMNHIKTMPDALFCLKKLRVLDMSDNDLNGIPSKIHNLANIVELNLSRNDISDVPEELRFCKLLSIFDLSSNPITRLPDSITQCTSMTHLGLNDVSLTQLPPEIGNLANLRSLEVRENLLRALPGSITKLSKLEVLDLGQNEIDLLPGDFGQLESLREFYADANELQMLPEQITMCRRLEQLDLSENRIEALPEDFGSLDQLSDINLSQNMLSYLPNSIGRLKKLSILKLDRNALAELSHSIGECDQLSEIMLTENALRSLPAEIGRLRHLKNLNADKNDIAHIPNTIGECQSLSILSLRSNNISVLPMEIGKCSHLRVLDLANNRLEYLPFTINVLQKLQALWLSEDQSQAMIKLAVARTSANLKVLTCYLLPQRDVGQHFVNANQPSENRGVMGGPKVHFPDMENTVDEEKMPVGQFERHDTPKPKSHKDRHKKTSIDGHIIPHEQGQAHDATLALSARRPSDTSPHAPQPAPRSALKFQSVSPAHYDAEPERPKPSHQLPQNSVQVLPQLPSSSNNASSNSLVQREMGKGVIFSPETPDSPAGCRLKRINTPHYKGVRGALQGVEKDRTRSPAVETNIRNFRIPRDEKGGLGLSIAGGVGSSPFKDGDSGVFISKVEDNKPAGKAGLRVGDKMIRVNGTDVVNATHDEVVHTMKNATGVVEITVLRQEESYPPQPQSRISNNVTPDVTQTLDMSFMSDIAINKENISATLKRDETGSPGFAVMGGLGTGRDTIVISSITPGGAAARHGRLQVGDIVLSINGTKMRGVRHDQVVALLTGSPQEEIYLVVQGERGSVSSPMTSTPIVTSPPATVNNTVSSPPPVSYTPIIRSPSVSVPVNHLGDTSSWDGKTEEVELHRDGKSLGLSVVGGSDHACHPFGVTEPGVFISKIAATSPAAKSGRLRIGDRILSVNKTDVRRAMHMTAVDALKNSGPVVRLVVTHDPQPSGLREVTVKRNQGEPWGITIHGGVEKAAIPTDTSDEGIFVEKVTGGSACDLAGLVPGHRLLEVNGEPLLGCKQEEAAAVLKSVTELKLLICNGYNKPDNKSLSSHSIYSSGVDENGFSPSPLPASLATPVQSPAPQSVIPPAVGTPNSSLLNGTSNTNNTSFVSVKEDSRVFESPLATSSPLPPPIVQKPSRIPPPVAPKPLLRQSQSQNVQNGATVTPETLTFASKLKKFEQEIEIKRLDAKQISNSSLPPPEKRSLLSEDDIKNLKESEERRVYRPAMSPEKEEDSFYDHLLDSDPFPRPPSIRTKKAENIAKAKGLIPNEDGLDDAERSALEQKKRSEWRAARLKSLDQERAEADAIMSKLQLNPMLSSISEDAPSVVADELSIKRSEHVDPVTGARCVTVEQNSIIRRQVDVDLASSDFGFADE